MNDESGFTLMETLLAIALLLICTGVAGGLVYNSRRIIGNTRERSGQYYRQLHLEKLIRESVEGVSIPYWEGNEHGIIAAREAIENALFIAGYKTGFELEPIKDSFGRIRGIRCRCFLDGYEYEGFGLFASVSLERIDQ
ncbi:MAG: prepilin-type N-terminal cleavage/methylation domain-containing protein [Treponema sp.]|nr:prepilin-type N-terminal cleavage/methylation domain-containing protein [Treponema sp.]